MGREKGEREREREEGEQGGRARREIKGEGGNSKRERERREPFLPCHLQHSNQPHRKTNLPISAGTDAQGHPTRRWVAISRKNAQRSLGSGRLGEEPLRDKCDGSSSARASDSYRSNRADLLRRREEEQQRPARHIRAHPKQKSGGSSLVRGRKQG